jgi:hypothetical protein
MSLESFTVKSFNSSLLLRAPQRDGSDEANDVPGGVYRDQVPVFIEVSSLYDRADVGDSLAGVKLADTCSKRA